MDMDIQTSKRAVKRAPREAKKPARLISRDSILMQAMSLIDSEGLAALTMRRLGKALGIEAMSIYYYFKNRDEVLDGVVEAVMLEISRHAERARKTGESWSDVARRIVRAYRTAGKAHANSFQLFATRPLRTKAAITQGRELVDAFAGAGLNNSDAVIAYRAITCFSAGFVLLETSKFKPAFSTGNFHREFNRSIDVILRGVQAEMLTAPPSRK